MEGKTLKQLLFDLELGLESSIKVEFRTEKDLMEFFNDKLWDDDLSKRLKLDSVVTVPYYNNHKKEHKRYLILMKQDDKIVIYPTHIKICNDYIYTNGKFFREWEIK